jgi:hypothetical protein
MKELSIWIVLQGSLSPLKLSSDLLDLLKQLLGGNTLMMPDVP